MSRQPDKLQGNQMRAVAPQETVWLSASAGTGKTHVLSSRVLRLLLQPGVEPSSVLCLTFTKAGATEMASRIRETLARWVRLNGNDLFHELEAIGAPSGPAERDRARTLFAAVLDCPGGGLRIDTIHAFSQWLLAAFPQEAGLVPGSRPMEDRERAVLARQVLADLLVHAEQDPLGDPQLLEAAADLSLRMGPDEVEAYLLTCAEAREAWFGPGAWQEPMRGRVLGLLGLPSDADEEGLAALCSDGSFDVASLRRCMDINAGWSAKTGQEAAAAMADWLSAPPAARLAAIDTLAALFLTQKGEPRASTSQERIDPEYPQYCTGVLACIAAVRERKALLALADRLVPALRLGRAFALAWDEAKQREGLIDFDDQIRRAAQLLHESELAEWIRYKLDRRFDHILVDEAQDTNAAQWDIIKALTDDYFAGLGQRDDLVRTLFVVGDYKQAIFRFQGTSPANFANAKAWFAQRMNAAAANAAMLRSNAPARTLRDYGLGRSFRTSQPVLDFVDAALASIGHEAFGLDRPAEPHEGWDRPGHVALWRPVGLREGEEGADPDEPDEAGSDWLSRPDRRMAENIAEQVAAWLDRRGSGILLAKEKRRANAGDIMVLVRKRRELAGLIVARLHAHGVPVAGVDRLRIGDPLAVRDLIAALRFAAQPLDDLNLAALLVSPLIGWSQEDLLRFGYREAGVRLWDHLRAAADPGTAPAMDRLRDLLSRADYELPQQLITWILSGPWRGRRALVERLGREANDPIDELLNAAHAYAAGATASLVGFLQWFDAGEGELKREADNAEGLVRVMTVHGSKGLQSPIVILADATGEPGSTRSRGFAMPDAHDERRTIPLPAIKKEEQVGRLGEHMARENAAELEEHWRLLYVAMTRAEEALFVGGALGVRDRGVPHPDSWYARLSALFAPDTEIADPIWGGRRIWGNALVEAGPEEASRELPLGEVLPPWLSRPPVADPRPPKPLAPSGLSEDDAPDPPLPPGAGGDAARRGTLIHKLLERLPEITADRRESAGRAWLERNARDLPAAQREEMLRAALSVLAEPDWADLFAPGSLAEVPIAATIGTRVIAGAVDRLLVTDARILVVDYKTARRPPSGIEAVPRANLRQMAAYVAALETVWPGRTVEAALLYTATPQLIAIPPAIIERHKRALQDAE